MGQTASVTSGQQQERRRRFRRQKKAPADNVHLEGDRLFGVTSQSSSHSNAQQPNGNFEDDIVENKNVDENDRETYSADSVGEQDLDAEIYFDAVDEDPRFPLTLSAAHKYVDADEFSKQVAENEEAARAMWANSYSEAPAAIFSVRGPDYLKVAGKNMKDLKVPSQESPYEVVGVNMFHCERRIRHVSDEVGELRRFFEAHPPPKDPNSLPTFLNINWIMSPLFGKECWVVNHVFRLKTGFSIDAPLLSAFKRFKNGTDSQKNNQFKYMFRIVDAPGPLKNTVSTLGGERPVIIGKSLTTTYNQGRNYLEINMDVSSSRIASAINGILLKNMRSVVCDLGWLLEGQREEELPERILAAVRFNWNCVEDVVVKLDQAGERL